MDELVIPASRAGIAGRTAILAGFALAGLSMLVGGIMTVSGHGEDYDGGYLFAGMGVLVTVIFGIPLVQALSSLRAQLRLTPAGYELNGRMRSWSAVEEFRPVGNDGTGGASHLEVHLRPGVPMSRADRASTALGKVGYYIAPTFIPVGIFDTKAPPLQNILQHWRDGDRSVRPPTVPSPRSEMRRLSRRRPVAADELLIPLRRSERIVNLLVSVAFFVILAGGLPWALADADDPPPWLVVVIAILWLVTTGATGALVYTEFREVRSPGLLLTSNGFEFDRFVWRWADIDAVQTVLGSGDNAPSTIRLRVVFLPDDTPNSAPADLPFTVSDFRTEGAAVDGVLRQWLQRYRSGTV
jgi:hypothetical protein